MTTDIKSKLRHIRKRVDDALEMVEIVEEGEDEEIIRAMREDDDKDFMNSPPYKIDTKPVTIDLPLKAPLRQDLEEVRALVTGTPVATEMDRQLESFKQKKKKRGFSIWGGRKEKENIDKELFQQ